jgi:hypothetical protein
MRILHILDHSLPLHSGYVFRTLAILREQRALGWQTLQLTTPRHGKASDDVEDVDGWRFHRTSVPNGRISNVPGVGYLAEMQATARRVYDLASAFGADVLHAHSPVLNALPALLAGHRLGIPWSTSCGHFGRTRRSTMARPPKAARAIASRGHWKRSRSGALPMSRQFAKGCAMIFARGALRVTGLR